MGVRGKSVDDMRTQGEIPGLAVRLQRLGSVRKTESEVRKADAVGKAVMNGAYRE